MGQPMTDASPDAEESPDSTKSVCTVYRPQRCWYHLSDPDQPPATPPCAWKHNCSFDLSERLACPFWESGTFDSIETEVHRHHALLRLNSCCGRN